MTLLARPDAPEAISDRRRNSPDRILLGTTVLLALLGLLMIYSATRVGLERNNLPASFSMERQMIFVAAGLILAGVFSLIDYREFRHLAHIVYGVTVVLLALVFLFPAVKGAQRWFDLGPLQLQPSEFSKTACVLVLATVLARPAPRLSGLKIVQALAVMVIPAVLIFLQPDLGTMLVFAFVVAVMLFGAGISARQALVMSGVGVAATLAIVQLGLLQEHQINRIRVLIDPTIDPTGIGWNLRQSILAVGSGQLTGKGLFQGQQTNFQYVPEQGTDFIFTAVGEQLGFVGGIVVIAAFVVLAWRLLAISAASRDRFGAMVALGIAAMFVFHVIVNIGMTVGIMPVTGIPLPFMSAGGSSFLNFSICVGIANSIWLRRSPVPGEVG